MLFRLTINEPEYDLDQPTNRRYLRSDLERLGFFREEGNEKYYTWFDKDIIRKVEFLELFKVLRLFAITYLLQPWEKHKD